MFRREARLSRTAAGTSVRRLFIRTTSAASIAISVPAPMAMPISARVRAGASFIPSPTIATLPCSFRERITASLPSGRTPAITSSTPACAPTAFAVRSLSPVSITTRMPMFRSCFTASGLSGFITSAAAMTPSSFPSRAKHSGVLPSPESLSVSARSSSGISEFSEMNFTLPPRSAEPFSFAESPLPGRAVNSSVSCGAAPFSEQYAMTAEASGCSLRDSSAQAELSSSPRVTPAAGITSVTAGSPFVMVPVLSSATMLTFPVSSSETAVLNSMPFFAPMPLPTIIATGVARPSAHGQLMTSTEIPLAREYPTV